MRSRLSFLLVTAFFVTMNVLLWRSEFGGHHQFGGSIPAEAAWEKIVTAPDNSLLSIRRHGKRIGTCHWSPSVGQERATGKIMSEDVPPEGMVERPTSYNIEVSGNLLVDEVNRLRFNFDINLTTNQSWQKLFLRLTLRPTVLELEALAADQSVRLRMDDGQERTDKVFTFSDLQHPDKLLKDLGNPILSAAISSLGLSSSANFTGPQPRPSLGLHWEARYDRLKVGGDWMRVIRLHARLLDRFQAVIFVSPVGEILKVELPDQITLMNDSLSSLSGPEDDRINSRR